MAQMDLPQLQVVKSKLTSELTNLDSQVKVDDSNPFVMHPSTHVICGKTGTGKSTVFLSVLNNKHSPYHRFFKHIFLVSPTASSDDKFKELVEELDDQGKYYRDINNETLEEIRDKLDAYCTRWVEKGKQKEKLNMCLVFDDCAHKLKSRDNKVLEEIVLRARHFRCWIFVLTQKYNAVPLIIRNQLSSLILFHTENQKELKTIIEEIGSDKDKFLAAYNYATAKPFSFLYVRINPVCVYYVGFDRIKFV
jgi:Cdc6-like AAA superfamily ATPase